MVDIDSRIRTCMIGLAWGSTLESVQRVSMMIPLHCIPTALFDGRQCDEHVMTLTIDSDPSKWVVGCSSATGLFWQCVFCGGRSVYTRGLGWIAWHFESMPSLFIFSRSGVGSSLLPFFVFQRLIHSSAKSQESLLSLSPSTLPRNRHRLEITMCQISYMSDNATIFFATLHLDIDSGGKLAETILPCMDPVPKCI